MVGLFRKIHFVAFIMAWNYWIFHGIMFICVLFMMGVEYYLDTLLSFVCENILKLEHDI